MDPNQRQTYTPPPYTPPAYQPPRYAPPPTPREPWQPPRPAKKRASGKAIAGMILGICSVVPLGELSLLTGFVTAILGLIFSCSGKRESRRNAELSGSGMATAGLTCSIIGLVFRLLVLAAVIVLLCLRPDVLQNGVPPIGEYI